MNFGFSIEVEIEPRTGNAIATFTTRGMGDDVADKATVSASNPSDAVAAIGGLIDNRKEELLELIHEGVEDARYAALPQPKALQ